MKFAYVFIFFLFFLELLLSNQVNSNFLELEKVFDCMNCTISFSPISALYFNGLVYVLDSKNIIYALNSNNSLEFSIGRNQRYEFISEPLSFSTDDNLIYVLDRENKKIFYFLSPSDYDYIEFNLYPSSFSPFLVLDNKFWFLNKDSSFILSFDPSKKSVEQYLSKGIGDGKINEPLDFTFANNYFIIADTRNRRVELFDKNLNFVSNIGLGPGVLLEYPNSIVADEDFIYVADSVLKSILLFDYEGNLIKMINYSDLNVSEVSDLFLNSSHLLLTSQKNKKILSLKIYKNKINLDLYERLNKLNEDIEKFSNDYSILFKHAPPSFYEEFSFLVAEFRDLQNLFDQRKFYETEKNIPIFEEKFSRFSQNFYKQLDYSLNNSLGDLLIKIKNVTNGSLVLSLKEYLDGCYLLLEKKDYLAVAKNIELIEKKLANYYNSTKLEKEVIAEKIITENLTINPQEETLKEQYDSFYEKVIKKKQDLISRANALNYSLNLFVLDQYIKAAEVAKKNSDYNSGLNYLLEADTSLSSLYEKILEYEQTIEILDEYKKNISSLINSPDSFSMIKLSKAYIIAQTNSTLAIEEAKKALELAQNENQFISLFPSPRVYAIFLFLFILGSIVIMGLIIFALIKSSLNKRKKQQAEIIIIKKAKRLR
ncbi:MAG: hypothetical protein QXG16_02485 [Candidatus Anstonellaceae archaeon]